MAGSEHTPGPMKFGHYFGGDFWIGPDFDQTPIARVAWDTDGARDEARENAAEIVKRWNAHEEMLGLLGQAVEAYANEVGEGGPDGFVARGRALIARDGKADVARRIGRN